MTRVMEVRKTYICQPDHISSGPVETCKDGVLENLVWKVDSKTIFKQCKAKLDCAIFAPMILVRLQFQHLASLPVVCFPRRTRNVVLTVRHIAAEGSGPHGAHKPFAKSGRCQ